MKVSEHRDAGRVRRANNSLRAALLRLAARRFDSISACIKRTSGKVPRTALKRRRADLQATASYDCTADRGQRVCWHLARAADDVGRLTAAECVGRLGAPLRADNDIKREMISFVPS